MLTRYCSIYLHQTSQQQPSAVSMYTGRTHWERRERRRFAWKKTERRKTRAVTHMQLLLWCCDVTLRKRPAQSCSYSFRLKSTALRCAGKAAQSFRTSESSDHALLSTHHLRLQIQKQPFDCILERSDPAHLDMQLCAHRHTAPCAVVCTPSHCSLCSCVHTVTLLPVQLCAHSHTAPCAILCTPSHCSLCSCVHTVTLLPVQLCAHSHTAPCAVVCTRSHCSLCSCVHTVTLLPVVKRRTN
jgi:hypothetical protein